MFHMYILCASVTAIVWLMLHPTPPAIIALTASALGYAIARSSWDLHKQLTGGKP